MARKVFVSVLGTGFYESCKYVSVKNDFVSSETRFIQQATLELIGAKAWSDKDKAFFLLTDKAKITNWDKSITKRKRHSKAQEEEPYESLESIIDKMSLPFEATYRNIPDGKDEDEMWRIFGTIFEELQEGDELYFDLTHSFRYLPMLVLVLNNYAKFLKNVTTKHISYGNYEARDEITNEAPIVDLLPLSLLQDWTFAAANYLRNGDVSALNVLCLNSLTPILSDSKKRLETPSANILKLYIEALQDLIEDMRWCRGINLLNKDHVKKVADLSQQLNEVIILPMKPVLEKMKTSFMEFTPTADILNGYRAAKWCYDNQLYQQSLTILHENMVSHICQVKGLDYKRDATRNPVNKAVKIILDKLPEDKWIVSNNEEKELIKKIMEMDVTKSLVSSFCVTTGLRNDFNHAGMRDNPSKVNKLKERLRERIEKIYALYLQDEAYAN